MRGQPTSSLKHLRIAKLAKIDFVVRQAEPGYINVGRLVVDHSPRLHSRTPRAGSQYGYLLCSQSDGREVGRGVWSNALPHRRSRTVCRHYEYCYGCACAPADGGDAFYAGETVPSLNVSSQESMPYSWTSPRNRLHQTRQVPGSCCSHCGRNDFADDGD